MKLQLGFKKESPVLGPGDLNTSRRGGLTYDPYHEIREPLVYDRSEDQPTS
jgi:hypothetical protein